MEYSQKHQQFSKEYPDLFDYLYRYICYRVVNRADAEDLASECVLQAYRRLDDFDPSRGNLRQWVTGIAKNLILMHWRKKRPIVALGEDVPLDTFPDASADEFLSDLSKKLSANRILSTLSDEHRSLLALRYIDDLTYEEIAEAIGKEPAAVRQFFSRLHKKLRLEFQEERYV